MATNQSVAKAGNPADLRILFLCKKENDHANKAAAFVKEKFRNALVYSGDRRKPLPQEILEWKGDLLISFISSWILPENLISNAGYAAINFHPGSPDYPGTGCTNFAIYEGAKEYGVTCHHMQAKVDAGPIISVRRFPIKNDDTVYSLTQHCYTLIGEMFCEIMMNILDGKGLPESKENWTRKPYTRKQLNELCTITQGMSPEEIEKRIKATTYKTPWAFTKIGSHIFKLQA